MQAAGQLCGHDRPADMETAGPSAAQHHTSHEVTGTVAICLPCTPSDLSMYTNAAMYLCNPALLYNGCAHTLCVAQRMPNLQQRGNCHMNMCMFNWCMHPASSCLPAMCIYLPDVQGIPCSQHKPSWLGYLRPASVGPT
jgi:hypothetical protein